MVLKLLSLSMDWEKLIAWIRAGQRCNESPSNTHDVTFNKNSNVNLIALTILAKRLILDAWLGPECASADGYISS